MIGCVLSAARKKTNFQKRNKGRLMKIPLIDLGECIDCEACIELCPTVFRKNEAGYIETIELGEYPKQELEEIIMNCPGQCITWEEI